MYKIQVVSVCFLWFRSSSVQCPWLFCICGSYFNMFMSVQWSNWPRLLISPSSSPNIFLKIIVCVNELHNLPLIHNAHCSWLALLCSPHMRERTTDLLKCIQAQVRTRTGKYLTFSPLSSVCSLCPLPFPLSIWLKSYIFSRLNLK